MRKLLILFLMIISLAVPAKATQISAPSVPNSAQDIMPEQVQTFEEGLWKIIQDVLPVLQPSFAQASEVCIRLIAAALLISVLHSFHGKSMNAVRIAGIVFVGATLLQPSDSLVQLGVQTVGEMSEYGKLLLPVMTAALAAQGGGASSAAIYTATAFFDSLLSSAISALAVPMVYVYIALAIASNAAGEEMLGKLRDFVKWLMTWCLKMILYVFTGYIGITGVISGTTDAAAMKAAKLTISGMVPVVGGILSDASEAVLVGAGVMKNAAGIYGLLAVIAICVRPFLQIGIQYLMLKLTGAICGVFGTKEISRLVQDFSTAMGLLLAMTGSVCLLLMISIVCFMKGVS